MRNVSVAEAKAHLSEIIQAVEAGEDIRITRHGKPVARLVREHTRAGRPIDVERLRRWQAETPMSSISAVDLIRAERDED
jgi:antitoxin (DNA-binding transcriptional repressor) of toxin-antitoxin stability system